MPDYNELLASMLARVPGELDKRKSSVIFNSLAPASAELASFYIMAEIFRDQTYLLTASSESLENRAADYGISRNPATRAVRIAELRDKNGELMHLSPPARFGVPNIAGGLNYALVDYLDDGRALLESETPGIIGNEHFGELLPLFTINNLGEAFMTGTYRPGEDTESDDALRQRVIDRIMQKSYGGNIADYREKVGSIDGVGAVKVFPAWQGGLTVKVSILDSGFNPATMEFLDLVQSEVDPIPNNGMGLGIAPIGHRVTLDTPYTVTINVEASINLRAGYTLPQVLAGVKEAIDAYLLSLRKDWAVSDTLHIYLSRIIAAILSAEGVDNVSVVYINGYAQDIELIESAERQEIPLLGEVILSGA